MIILVLTEIFNPETQYNNSNWSIYINTASTYKICRLCVYVRVHVVCFVFVHKYEFLYNSYVCEMAAQARQIRLL